MNNLVEEFNTQYKSLEKKAHNQETCTQLRQLVDDVGNKIHSLEESNIEGRFAKAASNLGHLNDFKFIAVNSLLASTAMSAALYAVFQLGGIGLETVKEVLTVVGMGSLVGTLAGTFYAVSHDASDEGWSRRATQWTEDVGAYAGGKLARLFHGKACKNYDEKVKPLVEDLSKVQYKVADAMRKMELKVHGKYL